MTAALTSAKKKARVRPGTLVMVCYPIGEKTNNPARKYDGEEMVVKDVVKTPKTNGLYTKQYTLFGAVGRNDVPYWFLEDELIVL